LIHALPWHTFGSTLIRSRQLIRLAFLPLCIPNLLFLRAISFKTIVLDYCLKHLSVGEIIGGVHGVIRLPHPVLGQLDHDCGNFARSLSLNRQDLTSFRTVFRTERSPRDAANLKRPRWFSPEFRENYYLRHILNDCTRKVRARPMNKSADGNGSS
jgi:hypothetical protein